MQSHRHEFPRDAACTDVDPEIFYPLPKGSVVDAKLVCINCPVRFECLDEAIGRGEEYGVFGGLTPMERHDYVMDLRATGLAVDRRLD